MKYIYVDYDKCTGCRICEISCSLYNYGECNTELSRIKVRTVNYDGQLHHAPIVCMNCSDAPCEKICPTGAIRYDEKLKCMIVDPEFCIGCNGCVYACPFGACHMDKRNGIAITCEQCGGKPKCVLLCPQNALFYNDIIKGNSKTKRIKNKIFSRSRRIGQ